MGEAVNRHLCSVGFMNKTQSHFWFSCLIVAAVTAMATAKVMTPEITAVIISTIIGSYIGNPNDPRPRN